MPTSSPKILAIETSQAVLSLGVSTEPTRIAHFPTLMRQAPVILGEIHVLLTQATWALSELDAIAVSVGPGRFTSIRLGISVAQGLALPFQIPLIPVSSLQVLAQGLYRLQGLSEVFLEIDAMMGERFVGHYALQNGMMRAVTPDAACSISKSIPAHFIATPEPHAEDLLTIAKVLWAEGKSVAADQIEPIYLREETAWRMTNS